MKKIGITLLLGLCLLVSGCSSSIKPMDYIDVVFDGANGYGKASVVYNSEGIYDEIYETMNKKGFSDSEINTFFYGTDAAKFRYELDKTEDLKNGDKVTVKLSWSDENLKKYKLSFGGTKEKEFTVKDLPEPVIINPFDENTFDVSEDVKGIHIFVEGISPLAQLRIQNDNEKNSVESKIQYSRNAENYVKNGDEITIQASFTGFIDNQFYTENDKTYVLSPTEHTYKVEGLDEYLTSIEKISDSDWEKLKELFTNVRNDYFRVNGNKYIDVYDNGKQTLDYVNYGKEVNNFKYTDAYLVSLRDGYNYEDNVNRLYNRLVVVFSFDAYGTSSFSNLPDYLRVDYKDLYGALLISNPVISPDGSLKISEDMIEVHSHVYTSFEELNSTILTIEKYKTEKVELNWD